MKTFLTTLLILLLTFSVLSQTAVVISENANLRGTPTEQGKIVDTVSRDTSLEIVKQRGAWFLVQTIDYVGWLHGNTIKLTSSLKSETSNNPVYTPKIESFPTSQPKRTVRQPTTNSGSYIRGPRGGCYYINSNGRKTYVDRSLCN